MSLLQFALIAASCVALPTNAGSCTLVENSPVVAGATSTAPVFTGEALDVVLTGESVRVWDLASGAILYDKNSEAKRPIASLSKLVTALVTREKLALSDVVKIPPTVVSAQRAGVDIALPIGHHASVSDLLLASMVASANDAALTLATALGGDEAGFVAMANEFAVNNNLPNTRVANASGLAGGEQYSTARDVQHMMELAYQDSVLRDFLSRPSGTLSTQEGARRQYTSTNKLLKTYVPISAAKTGYTLEAKENLVIVTEGSHGQQIGVVVLGSGARFQDTKVLVEWIWRNYTWTGSNN